MPARTFTGTKRELEILKRQHGGSMSVMPRYRTLSLDARVHVDADGVIYTAIRDGKRMTSLIIGQCLLKEDT
jgi:hypothetical protein